MAIFSKTRLARSAFGIPRQNLGRGDITLDAWGTQRISHDWSIFSSVFAYNISPKTWILHEDGVEQLDPNVNNYGSGVVNGTLSLKSGTGVSYLTSRRHPRYQSNRGHKFSTAAFFPIPTAAGARRIGLFTPDNGVYFSLENGVLYACLRSLGVEFYKEKIVIPFPFDFSKGNLYDIQFQWRGVGDFFFYVSNSDTKELVKVHETDFLGKREQLSFPNPSLSVGLECESGGDDVEIRLGCVDVTSEGGRIPIEHFISASGNEVVVDANGSVLLAVRIPETFIGQLNTKDIDLLRISASSDKKSYVKAFITRDSTALTVVTGSWVGIDAGNIEAFQPLLDADATFDPAKADELIKKNLEANTTIDYDNPAPDKIDQYLIHGDYLIVVGYGASANMSASIVMGEEA